MEPAWTVCACVVLSTFSTLSAAIACLQGRRFVRLVQKLRARLARLEVVREYDALWFDRKCDDLDRRIGGNRVVRRDR